MKKLFEDSFDVRGGVPVGIADAAERDFSRRRQGGFTLLEIMAVLAIIIILATLAAGSYQKSVDRAKEAALHQDLSEMRKAIDDYTLDKEAAPSSLDDLVTAQYLHQIPTDPMTHSTDWNTEDCDTVLSPDQSATGICNVRSTSDQVSPFENTAYSSW